jgi:thymidine kinase
VNKEGWVEVITGPMFSGKTEAFVHRVNRATRQRQLVRVFRPTADSRTKEIISHSGHKLHPSSYLKEAYIADLLDAKYGTSMVAIDEAQFFPPSIVPWVKGASERGLRVIIAGLDRDYRGEAFGSMKDLIFLADHVDKLPAVCAVCCRDATRTQRKDPSGPVTLVGAEDLYEPRCKLCHRF